MNMNKSQARTILNLPINFTKEELKKAYRCMSKKYHPDLNPGKNTEEKMKEINYAFETLKEHIENIDKKPKSFNDIKNDKLTELEEYIKGLRNFKVNDYNRSIIELYAKARSKENQIYIEYIEEVRNSVNLSELESVEKTYEYNIKCLIDSFVERLFSCWEIDLSLLTFYRDFESELEEIKAFCKDNISVNEVFKRFNKIRTFINQENNNLKTEVSNKIQNQIEKIILKHKSNLYYNDLSVKIEQLRNQVFNECMNIRTSREYQNDKVIGEANIKSLIDSIDGKVEQLFNDYSIFLSKKQEKSEELKSLSEKCPINHKEQINILINSLIEKLDLVEDYSQLEIWFNNSQNQIDLELNKIYKLVEEENKQAEINNIKVELLLKFGLLENKSIEEAQINSSILSRSLDCLLSFVKGKLEFENILWLRQISFKNVKNDEDILNFITKESEGVILPTSVTPVISDEKLMNLYEKIKPIVDVNQRKHLIREFAVDELRNSSYLNNLDDNVTEEIDMTKLEALGDFDCYHTISSKEIFEPKVSDVLAQMPGNIIVNAAFFEIVGVPKIVKDATVRFINPSYHMSKVRAYSLKK